MAQRRMFSKTITNSSQFLMMPQSTQNLYFHLGMNSDDDGFCEHFSIMRMTDSKPDDLKILQVKGFVNVFDDRVLIIKDRKENNYIRSDRYTPSKYLEIYKSELALLSNGNVGIPMVDEMATQVRLGKGSVEKERIDNINTEFEKFWELYNKKIGSKSKCLKKFNSLNKEEKDKIFNTLPRRLANIKDKQYQPHPLTYLNNERRNDELDIKFKTGINVGVRQQKQFDSDFIPL